MEKELIKGIAMELLDIDITENRLIPKGNSYFIRKKNKTPTDVNLVKTIPQVNEYESVSDADEQLNDITLKT